MCVQPALLPLREQTVARCVCARADSSVPCVCCAHSCCLCSCADGLLCATPQARGVRFSVVEGDVAALQARVEALEAALAALSPPPPTTHPATTASSPTAAPTTPGKLAPPGVVALLLGGGGKPRES